MIILTKFTQKPKMKNKAILVSFIALLAIAFVLTTVMASNMVSISEVRVNGIAYDNEGSTIVAGEVSDTVPVEVEFTANRDVEDVRVRVSIEGYKEDVYESTPRFLIVNGSKYVKRFALKLPSGMDLDELTEQLNLNVRITAKDEDDVEEDYAIEMQKDLYSLNILSIDAPNKAVAGNTIALDVVLENNGNSRLDNTYVKASIPELGVERTVYFGDLSPKYSTEYEESYDDIRDTNNKVMYLSLPRNAVPGTYNIQVEAYNYDTSVVAKQKLVVEGVSSGILSASTSRTVSVGEETTFDVVLVNPNDRMVVYSLTPSQSTGLIIDVSEPVVTVAADSSRTVQVKVKATESATEGTHVVTVNVNTESGLERKADFTLNVEKASTSTPIVKTGSDTVLILTVILVIIFVVLLIVLIVLLTKRPAETEEFGETSYY